eukprot:1825471-Rhodomonas_salina.3
MPKRGRGDLEGIAEEREGKRSSSLPGNVNNGEDVQKLRSDGARQEDVCKQERAEREREREECRNAKDEHQDLLLETTARHLQHTIRCSSIGTPSIPSSHHPFIHSSIH